MIDEESQAAAAVGESGDLIQASLHVVNKCRDFDNGNNFYLDPRSLPGRPTVGDVRRAIAHHMGRPAAKTELRRWVGRIESGEEVVEIFGNCLHRVYAEVTGQKNVRKRDVKEKERKILLDDDQPFLIVHKCGNMVYVHPR